MPNFINYNLLIVMLKVITAEFRYAECHSLFTVMLARVVLSAGMLRAEMLYQM